MLNSLYIFVLHLKKEDPNPGMYLLGLLELLITGVLIGIAINPNC